MEPNPPNPQANKPHRGTGETPAPGGIGVPPVATGETPAPHGQVRWWKELNRYHWFVFVVAALGWLFDTMDQQLFALARMRAVGELVPELPELTADENKNRQVEFGGYATAIFLVGWAVGGLGFGVMGDRFGRAKTMAITILVYSVFTGLSAFSVGFWDFALYRFLTGLGVGGEFAVGVSLLAEVVPERARPFALGWLQSLSAVGNVTAAVLTMLIPSWRVLFLVGTAPALLVVVIRARLREPERWQAVAAREAVRHQLGSFKELFGDPRWRKNAIVGLLLAFAGVVGLWGVAFFSYDLFQQVFAGRSNLPLWLGLTSILQNVAGFFGIHAYSWMTHRTSRRFAFLVSFVAAMVSTAGAFLLLGKVFGIYDIFWLIPIMGFCQLAVFGGYAIYFPELFPTRLRSTGTSFCYNFGRLFAAVGPLTLGLLTSRVYGGMEEPFRWAAVTMCSVFLISIAALPFAPETSGKPLPE